MLSETPEAEFAELLQAMRPYLDPQSGAEYLPHTRVGAVRATRQIVAEHALSARVRGAMPHSMHHLQPQVSRSLWESAAPYA